MLIFLPARHLPDTLSLSRRAGRLGRLTFIILGA
jgi:hypothetical protein